MMSNHRSSSPVGRQCHSNWPVAASSATTSRLIPAVVYITPLTISGLTCICGRRPGTEVPRRPAPGHAKIADVGGSDLIRGRIPRRAGVAAEEPPFGLAFRRACAGLPGQGRRHPYCRPERDDGRKHSHCTHEHSGLPSRGQSYSRFRRSYSRIEQAPSSVWTPLERNHAVKFISSRSPPVPEHPLPRESRGARPTGRVRAEAVGDGRDDRRSVLSRQASARYRQRSADPQRRPHAGGRRDHAPDGARLHVVGTAHSQCVRRDLADRRGRFLRAYRWATGEQAVRRELPGLRPLSQRRQGAGTTSARSSRSNTR